MCLSVHRGVRGARMAGGHAWQGVCAVEGHAWQGACMVGACMVGGMCGRGHAWQGARHTCPLPPRQILRDTVNERAVRILLECILVYIHVFIFFPNSVLILLVVFSRDVRTS